MDWKKWITSHVRGTPMSLSWLPRCFPIPVVTYGITKLGPDGMPVTPTRQMTLANLGIAQPTPQVLTVSWDYGITVPSKELPKPTAVDQGSIAFAVEDVLALRQSDVRLKGMDPHSGRPREIPAAIYALYIQEGDGLLAVEIIDMKEKLDGEMVEVPVAKEERPS